jgi:epoxide hydrolase-like predicted phosphatase
LISPNIRNLIFDLGGVILNLDISASLKQLAGITKLPMEKIIESYSSRAEFQQYERGEIDDEQFRAALRNIYSFSETDAVVDECWNAMLLDIPTERIDMLKRLTSRYRTFLLSNTNSIHVRSFSKSLRQQHGIDSLDSLFEKAYYSHLVRMRKPDPEIYRYVLKANGLNAAETLFLDDNERNIEGARTIGLQVYLVRDPDQLSSLFQ